jgi:two-component system cell cycle response regulator
MEQDDTANRQADATMVGQSLHMTQGGGHIHKASLIMLSGSEIGREIELGPTEMVVGRSPLNHTTIGDPSISRSHARICHVKEGEEEYFEITDLNSRNGTQINGIRVNTARLRNGDKVQMGDVLLKFVVQDALDAQFYREIHRRIHYDQLTGLLTMDAFRRELDSEIDRKDPATFTLAMTDLDGLKKVNDTYGHLAGRMVVREMGAIIRRTLRESDRPALYGGDETIILYRETGLATAHEVAEQIRLAVEARVFEFRGQTFKVSISQGLAEWPQHGRTPEEIIASADGALYAAKAAGRNCVRIAGE